VYKTSIFKIQNLQKKKKGRELLMEQLKKVPLFGKMPTTVGKGPALVLCNG
jgi:hypothetical protein